MSVRVVRLGSPRLPDEGVRLGTVRHLPRGVRKSRYAVDDWFDVWLPNLAPTAALISAVKRPVNPMPWRTFVSRYESEMAKPEPRRVLDALAALSHSANFSVGCYCEDDTHCHRSVLGRILAKHGARVHSARSTAAGSTRAARRAGR